MKKNLIITFLIILNIVTLSFSFYLWNENNSLSQKIKLLLPENKVVKSETKQNCTTKENYYNVDWVSMEPMIKNGEKIKVIENYYTCNSIVNRWDIIIYESFTTNWPIIKQVKVLPWDIVKFENNNMYINWEILINSVWEVYTFSQDEVKYMSMYIQENSKLQNWAFFAFWDNIKNSIDSRKMWWLWINNFKAKVILE